MLGNDHPFNKDPFYAGKKFDTPMKNHPSADNLMNTNNKNKDNFVTYVQEIEKEFQDIN